VFSDYNNSCIILFPSKKINKSGYRCSNKFELDSILEMYKPETCYGVVLISGNGFRCYSVELTGTYKNFKLLDSMEVKLQNRHKTGGSSFKRFERIREEKQSLYVDLAAESAVKSFMKNNNTICAVAGLIIGGPGEIKKELLDTSLFNQYFSDKIVQTINTTEIVDGTIYEVYNKYSEHLISDETKKAIVAIKEVDDLMTTDPDKLNFGDEVLQALKDCMLSKLLVSDKLNEIELLNIKQLNTYDCELIPVEDYKLRQYGKYVGIKFY
jgi:peptide subunit release factor 1 (eRF1)